MWEWGQCDGGDSGDGGDRSSVCGRRRLAPRLGTAVGPVPGAALLGADRGPPAASRRYIRSERSVILINFCLSIISSNALILIGQTQTRNRVGGPGPAVRVPVCPGGGPGDDGGDGGDRSRGLDPGIPRELREEGTRATCRPSGSSPGHGQPRSSGLRGPSRGWDGHGDVVAGVSIRAGSLGGASSSPCPRSTSLSVPCRVARG